MLEQTSDNGDAIVVLTEAVRSKEDIQTSEEQLERYPKKDDISFNLASANLLLQPWQRGCGRKRPSGRRLPSIPILLSRTWRWDYLYLLEKDQKRAGEEFKKAAELAPVRSMERLKYAAFMSAAGDKEETRRISTEMTRQAPDYLPGWTLLAELAFKDKKYEEALSLLESVFSRDPENFDGHRLESEVLAGKGRHEKSGRMSWSDSTKPIRTLLSSNTNWRAHILKTITVNQAKVVLDQVISRNPNYADAILLLAATLTFAPVMAKPLLNR